MHRRIIRGATAALGILILILDSKTALSGARDGIDLCIRSVVPSIFPFLVLSCMLTSAMTGYNMTILQPLGRLIGIPRGAEALFLTGIVGGYPIGAQAVHQAWSSGQLNIIDARRMLAFCSNAGPSFLFGILGTQFSGIHYLWILWSIHILSALAVGIILPNKNNTGQTSEKSSDCTFPESLKKSVHTMAVICGWVIFFRVVLAFFDRWILWILPIPAQISVHGLLELANGCCSLNLIASESMRFVIASGMLAFGGICVILQTVSVTGSLGIGQYLLGKCLQTIISLLLSMTMQYLLFPPAERIQPHLPMLAMIVVLSIVIVGIHRNWKNRGSIPALYGV